MAQLDNSLLVNPFYAASDAGFANSNGIVFSNINSNAVSKPISNAISAVVFSNPIQTQISKPPDASVQSSNFDNAINFNSHYLQPINLPISQAQTIPIKSHASYSSSGFTFAPLIAAISVPMIPLQTGNSSTQQIHFDNQVFSQQPPPSTTTLPSVNNELAVSIPINKCGITKYLNSRVVGGSVTQIGQYPWVAALYYRFPNASTNEFYCSGSLITR